MTGADELQCIGALLRLLARLERIAEKEVERITAKC